ncbi:hypothetical protein AAZX31_02G128900 [Glycine max]
MRSSTWFPLPPLWPSTATAASSSKNSALPPTSNTEVCISHDGQSTQSTPPPTSNTKRCISRIVFCGSRRDEDKVAKWVSQMVKKKRGGERKQLQ